MKRQVLQDYLDNWFADFNTGDDVSCNGLQVPGGDDVLRLAVAVDACLDSFQAAARQKCDFLFVHHGLFWNYNRETVLSGLQKEKLKLLFDYDISLYAMHLPLDRHPETGNNAVICRELGLLNTQVVFDTAFVGNLENTDFATLIEKAKKLFGGSLILERQFHERPIQKVMVVSGGGASALKHGVSVGADTFITGEMSHYMYHFAKENKINVILGGHYQTEVFGVQATAAHLSERFGLESVFLDFPTGL